MVRGVHSGSSIPGGGAQSGLTPAQQQIGLAISEAKKGQYKDALGHLENVKEDLQKTHKLTSELKVFINLVVKDLRDLEEHPCPSHSPEGDDALNNMEQIRIILDNS